MKNCHVQNEGNTAQNLYLIGTSAGYDKCPMSTDILDLHIASEYTPDTADWTTSGSVPKNTDTQKSTYHIYGYG